MIIAQKENEVGKCAEITTYSLIEGKLVITTDLYDDERKVYHDVTIPYHDGFLTRERLESWIEAGVV